MIKIIPVLKNFRKKLQCWIASKNLNEKIINNYKKKDAIFNFLVFAGSQGSFDILDILKKFFDDLENIPNLKKIKFYCSVPFKKQREIRNLLIKKKYNFEIREFFENFDFYLRNAEIALCRSGAGTINDLIIIKYQQLFVLCLLLKIIINMKC